MKDIRKISLLLAIITIASALLCSCGKDDAEAEMGWKKISDDGVSYHFFVPDEWTADITTGVTTAYVSGVDTSNVSMMSFVLPGREVQSIEDYWKLYEPELKAMFADLEYDLNGEDTRSTRLMRKSTFTQEHSRKLHIRSCRWLP